MFKHFLPVIPLVVSLAACSSQIPQPSADDASRGQLQIQSSAPLAQAPAASPFSDPIGNFAFHMLPHARQAAERLGVDPALVVAHAGLESGWGKKPIRFPDGRDSYNLFSLKAYDNWAGETVNIRTTEYENGRKVSRVEAFRAYPSYEAAFRDYASLLASNSRYAKALGRGDDAHGFARSLQQGGYATDPRYASKFASVARKVVQVSEKISA